MFARPLVTEFADRALLVALFDSNTTRLEFARKDLGRDIPTFTDFDRMLREANPDAVVIATKDSTHAEFMVKTLAAGKRAIC
jgi:predicted dehydrogenase